MKEWQVFHKSQWFKVDRSLGYIMVPFWGGVTHLRGCYRPLKTDDIFEHICDSLKGTQDSLIWSRICPYVWPMVFYTPWFGFLNMSLSGCLLGQKVPIFEMSKNSPFLGGLSLHLNHLIASWTGISFLRFGTLPIGIFLSNLDSRHLMTSPRNILGQFWHMSIFGDSRAIRVICQKMMPSENQFFLDEGAMGHQSVLGL